MSKTEKLIIIGENRQVGNVVRIKGKRFRATTIDISEIVNKDEDDNPENVYEFDF